MTVGIVILAHENFDRVAQIALHWVNGGCPVVIHVDQKVSNTEFSAFRAMFASNDMVHFSKRHRCEWGMWSIVAATQDASELLLETYPCVSHVFLSSGSCVPLRPVQELRDYLDVNINVDFIESVTTADAQWAGDGLEMERFTLRFPFSWHKKRRLFDKYVNFQRRIGRKRSIPKGLTPHIGSQWWCLTRYTLSAILNDPLRDEYDKYFRRVWIPDESYFQTMARVYSRCLESCSLTLSKFDFQGKPHIFYDDHIQLLRKSDCFVARKIWFQADRLFDAFLRTPDDALTQKEPQPSKIDHLFSRAIERRTRGRPGLSMQSRFPNEGWENGLTAGKYTILQGFDYLFEDFQTWLSSNVDATVHGHIFHPDRVQYADNNTVFKGAMSDNAALRDYNPYSFVKNFIWNTRGQHQCFMFSPLDNTKQVHLEFVKDPNAHISIISGAWLIHHFHHNRNLVDIRKRAALCQKYEQDHLKALQSPRCKAQYHLWTLAEFLENPAENLKLVLEGFAPSLERRVTSLPKMVDLTGFKDFVHDLKNQGMHPNLLSDFNECPLSVNTENLTQQPYVVR